MTDDVREMTTDQIGREWSRLLAHPGADRDRLHLLARERLRRRLRAERVIWPSHRR